MTVASGFSDHVARTLTDGRSLAEARMDSLCRIRYNTGRTAMSGGIEAPVYVDRATDVPCRVHPPKNTGEDITPAAGSDVRVHRTISVPHDTEVEPKDIVELTEAGALTDSALVGRPFRVVDAGYASQATARRLQVEEDA